MATDSPAEVELLPGMAVILGRFKLTDPGFVVGLPIFTLSAGLEQQHYRSVDLVSKEWVK